jgi:hypothetical protein
MPRRCAAFSMASTVRQITLMPPTTPPMTEPRDTDLSAAALVCASLCTGQTGSEVSDAVMGMTAGVVKGDIVDRSCEAPLADISDDAWSDGDSANGVVDELVSWIVKDNEIIIADAEGGFA